MRYVSGYIELRKEGAIGEFTVYPCRTQADSLEQARQYLIDDAHMEGYEVRGIIDLRPLESHNDYVHVGPNVWDKRS